MEDLSRSIWQLTEHVLEQLRADSRHAVHSAKRDDVLWLDELTETQGNTVIAVRQLCDQVPEGVPLKKLAETLGITPAGASVMVDLLVKKKMLKRSKSKSDRRAILIRLTPDTADLFDVSERTLMQNFMCLKETLGRDALIDWQRILLNAESALRQVCCFRAPAETESPEQAPEPDSIPDLP